jgi:hypothetical protein
MVLLAKPATQPLLLCADGCCWFLYYIAIMLSKHCFFASSTVAICLAAYVSQNYSIIRRTYRLPPALGYNIVGLRTVIFVPCGRIRSCIGIPSKLNR